MKCANCDNILGPGARFCAACSAPVEASPPPPRPAFRPAASPIRAAVAAPQLEAPSPSGDIRYRSSGNQTLYVLILLLAVAVAAGGYFFYSSHQNKLFAEQWQKRAETLSEDVALLNSTLAERTDQVNNRTNALNATARKLTTTQRALSRSEGDVGTLEKRQRALANEKAQVEDQRATLVVQAATLEQVADDYQVCNAGLFELLDAVLDEDYDWAVANIDSIGADCRSAQEGLAIYKQRFGS